MRYLKTIGGIILYLLFACLVLFPVLVIRVHLENTHYAVAVSVWACVMGILFIPALAMIIKKVWFFAGNGEPVSLDHLKAILLEINEFSAPVCAQNLRKKIVISWRHQDQIWCELLEKKRTKKLYELWLHFDNSTKTVVMSDRYRSVDWTLSPIKLKTGWLALSKPYFRVSTGLAWGVENYLDSNPQDYNFTPNEIKSPILNTLLKNGWSVRFSLF